MPTSYFLATLVVLIVLLLFCLQPSLWRMSVEHDKPPGYVSGAPGGVKYFKHLDGGE